MLLEAIEIGCAALWVGIGAAAGVWLCRADLRAARRARDSMLLARESLRRAEELTTSVAKDVGAHNSRVQAINQELTAHPQTDANAVMSTITRLVTLNQEMQKRLADAETRLQERSKELQLYETEARTDILTRLPNRRAFEEEAGRRFAEFTRRGTPFCVLMFDVDHFKKVNDENGHRVGDEVLRVVAATLRQTLRTIDLVARYGGEEFMALLPCTTMQDARLAAERCREAVAKSRTRFDGLELAVTISVGASETSPKEQLAQLLRRADTAMYAAKEGGRNRSYWHDGHDSHPTLAPESETRQEEPPAAETTPPPAAAAPPPPETASPASAAQPAARGPRRGATDTRQAGAVSLARLVKSDPQEFDRTVLLTQVRQRIAEWKRGGLGFSLILVRNDCRDALAKSLGAEAGDAAAQMIRRVLRASLREMDVIGHYGAGCFAMLLPCTHLQEAVIVSERIRKEAAESQTQVKNGVVTVTVSAGAAEVIEGDDVVRICQRAEAALHAAGRNRVCYHDGQWPQPAERLAPPGAPLAGAGDLPLQTHSPV